ncbi:MAG: VOC family protein [Rickettsiales bacterium]|jgi:PhnB protein|nr:VOC family protein [Rickettsiales bacterium]
MTFELFFNFNNGQALIAAEFYAKIFKSSVENIMLYKDAPADPNYPIPENEKDYLMYACVQIADKKIMFMDMSASFQAKFGNNINPTINAKTREEVDYLFAELSNDGQVFMAPQKTFFSEYYAMVTDKFGITWHILINESQ